MARKLLIPLSAAAVGALIAASPAAAATVTDCKDLQSALDEQSTVTLAEGLTCTGSWELPSHPIVLEGGGSGATLRGDGESRILSGWNISSATIRNLHFVHGRSSDSGGAVYIAGHDGVTIERSTFAGNTADGSGGAVYVDYQGPRLTLAARTAQGAEPAVRVTIAGNVFGGDEDAANSSDQDGGALYVRDDGPVAITGNTFEGNRTVGTGGGADVTFCGTATVAGNTFEGNGATGRAIAGRTAAGLFGGRAAGGGLAIGSNQCFSQFPSADRGTAEAPPAPSDVEQSGNTFHANTLTTGPEGTAVGAGESASYVTLSSTDDVFDANAIGKGTVGIGGGLYVEGGDASLRNFVATANRIDGGQGGGVAFNSYGDTLSVVHGTTAANTISDGEGSAIWGQSNTTLLVDNSIVHGNTGGPEISGFLPGQDERAAAGAAAGRIELDYTLACTEEGAAYEGDGNLCADPKLANAAGGDVHQTAASPTHDKASKDLSGGLTKDYEGDGRFLNYDRANGDEPDMGADEAPAPAQQSTGGGQQPAPAASGGVLGTQARSCTSRRTFKIKLRNRGQKVVKATVIVNGKRVKVLRGKRLTSRVDLRGLPKGRFSVRIKLQLANGDTLSGVRRYYTCRPGRPSGPPKV